MKKLIALLIVLTLLVGGAAITTAADNTVTVYVDGVRVNFPDQKAYINSDNRTLVPVRFVSEALGADVEWNAAARQVNVKHKGQNITLTIGQRVAKVNTGQVTLDTTASITNDRTMVPLRFVSECLNAQVDWNGQARAVYITTGIENITQFVGKPMAEDTITRSNGSPIYDGILAPGEEKPQYMYVTPEQLPVKVGNSVIYSIVPGEKYVSVKQSHSTGRSAIQILYIQDGIMVGAKKPYGLFESNHFTVNYDVQDRTAEALGDPKVDIYKVDAFAFRTRDIDGTLLYLIVENPLNRGDWRP